MVPLKAITRTALMASVLLSSNLLMAQEYDNSANISAGIVGYFFDSKRNQDDDIGVTVGGELPLTGRLSTAIDYYTLDSDVDTGSTAESDLDYYRVGLNYHLNQISGWQPYAGIGLGKLEIEQDLFPANDHNHSTWDIALGVKRRISDNWLVRGDYKMIFGDNPSAQDSAVSVGLAYAFGGSKPAAARPAAAAVAGDSDNDGVPDNRDACANTPAGTRVDSRGCELDSDRDGVVDSRDKCPDTPTTLAVDADGCPILERAQRRVELKVNFDFDKSDVKPQYDREIGEFADFMETYSNTNVLIEGHTDSRGSDQYNQGLSERRANAVRDELVNEHNISAGRIDTIGYGEGRPVDTNDTDAARANNRRIEAVISVDVEEQRRR